MAQFTVHFISYRTLHSDSSLHVTLQNIGGTTAHGSTTLRITRGKVQCTLQYCSIVQNYCAVHRYSITVQGTVIVYSTVYALYALQL